MEQGLAPARVRALAQEGPAFPACQVGQRTGRGEAAPGQGLGAPSVREPRRDAELRNAIGSEDVWTGARGRARGSALGE